MTIDETARLPAPAEHRLLRVLEALPTAAVGLDADGAVEHWNAGAQELLGHTAESALGRPLAELLPAATGVVEQALQRLDAGERLTEFQAVARDRRGRPVEVAMLLAPVFDDDGRRAGVAAVALDVAERHAAERRLRRLVRALRELSPAAGVDDVAAISIATAVDLTGASAGAVLLRRGRVLEVTARHGRPPGLRRSDDTVPLGASTPAAQAARSGRPVWLVGDGDVVAGGASAAGVVALPLRTRRETLGSLLLGFPPGRELDEEEREFALLLAGQCADALAHAQAYEEEHRAALTLQRSLLPAALPPLPGADLAVAYHPIGEGAEVGGDFYDAFRLDDGAVLVVGDVCGKGVEAAALTGMVRYTIRSLSRRVARPQELLTQLNAEVIAGSPAPERFCTVAYARLWPVAGGFRAVLACAGHPLPLVLRADGSVDEVGACGSLIGIWPTAEFVDHETMLRPGDTLLLYTDGVTEARRGSEFFGERRLRAAVEACAGCSASDVIGALEAALWEFQPRRHDDAALLALGVQAARGSD